MQDGLEPNWSGDGCGATSYDVAAMVTHIYRSKRRLFLREHREAAGITAEDMGNSLEPNINARSVYRIEREWRRCDPIMQEQWAFRCRVEPDDLWHKPNRASLDALVRQEPAEVRLEAFAAVQRVLNARK
jgi:hypothetical protein